MHSLSINLREISQLHVYFLHHFIVRILLMKDKNGRNKHNSIQIHIDLSTSPSFNTIITTNRIHIETVKNYILTKTTVIFWEYETPIWIWILITDLVQYFSVWQCYSINSMIFTLINTSISYYETRTSCLRSITLFGKSCLLNSSN